MSAAIRTAHPESRGRRHPRRAALILAAVALGLAAAVLPAMPAAEAAVAPWTWQRVTKAVSVQPTTSYAERALCPTGFTAVTGGLQLPSLSTLITQGQYRSDDGSGSGWTVLFRNNSASSGTATVVAECVETIDLPPISYQGQSFAKASGSNVAEGTVSCPDGQVVLTGGADWNSTATSRYLNSSTPDFGGVGWYGAGYNTSAGATLYVEVYCVDPAFLAGWQRIELSRGGLNYTTDLVTCPLGKRVLNGGASTFAFASYPNRNTWTVGWDSGSQVIRAFCIDAGTPTVTLNFASPGPSGSTFPIDNASFSWSGTDPAGFPNGFRCSLDGASPTICGTQISYFGLASGLHQLVLSNVVADGRSSGPLVYQWTVDTVDPTVTKPKLPRVTLGASTRATWEGADEHSSIDHYEAAYNLFGTDGTPTGWIKPTAWNDLGPSVRTLDLAEGESVCISVRAVDVAGNASGWSAPSCTTRPLDDRALTTSTNSWSRLTGSSFWLNTVTSTTASGQTLSRNNVHLNRAGIVATQCAGCGTVVVRLDGTTIGRVNLDATTTTNRKVRLIKALSAATSGTVTIRSVTTGQTISIDGLVAIQGTTSPPAP